MAGLDVKILRLKSNNRTSVPLVGCPLATESVIGYGSGTAWYKSDAGGGIDRKLVEVTKTAIKYGYYHLDGAEVYNSEAKLGLAIKESKVPREKLFSSPTKVITNIKDIPNAIDSSLKKLQLDYIDLYLIHASFFASSDADLQSAWAAMEQVKASGKTKSSSPTFTATMKTATVAASINQIEYHPYLQHGGADAKGD